MKRPVFWILCFYLMGIICGRYWDDISNYILLSSMIFVAFTCLTARALRSRYILIFPLFSFLGFLLFQSCGQFSAENRALNQLAEKDNQIEIVGMVETSEITQSGKTRLIVTDCSLESLEKKLDFEYRVMVFSDSPCSLEIGDVASFKGKLALFEPPRNPGGFDEITYYSIREIDCSIFAESYQKLNQSEATIFSKIAEFRNKMSNTYTLLLPKDASGMLRSLIIGDKADLGKDLKELYKIGGISHVLAISGLHISILSLIVFFLLKEGMRLNKRLCSMISIFFLCFYFLFSGGSVSTARAVIMSTIILMGNLFFREGDLLNSISLAALLILLKQPIYFWDIGFQLSFVTVTGLCLGSEIIKSQNGLPEWAKKYFCGSIVASMASYPLVAYYFGSVPVWGVFVNLIVLPFMGVLVGFGLLSGIAGILSVELGVFLSGIVYVIYAGIEAVCTFVSNIEFHEWNTGYTPASFVIGIYVVMLLIYFYNEERKWTVLLVCVTVSVMFLNLNQSRIFQKVEITFLDVGQGDSSVIHTYDNVNIVIDTGGYSFEGMTKNTSQKILIPYFKQRGIQQIDILFLTHMDTDHSGGAVELLENFDVKQVVISDFDREPSMLLDELIETLHKKQIPLTTISAGQSLSLPNGLYIDCVYPFENSEALGNEENSSSLALKLSYGKNSFLFTGDIGAEEEKQIINSAEDIDVDVLKVAHHGSKYSSSEEFLADCSPKFSVISSGKNNVYGHPSNEVLERLNKLCPIYFNTADTGAVMFETDGKNIRVETMLGR